LKLLECKMSENVELENNMTDDKTTVYIIRIDSLLKTLDTPQDYASIDATYLGTLSMVIALYGQNSAQHEFLLESRKTNQLVGSHGYEVHLSRLKEALIGCLQNTKQELEQGLIERLVSKVESEVIGDFVVLAKEQIDAGFKDVAAVLATAALEDVMKRKTKELELDVDDKSLDQVINALKSESFFEGAQKSVVSSYVQLRNAALHADWDKIKEPEVSSLIAFLESFLLEDF